MAYDRGPAGRRIAARFSAASLASFLLVLVAAGACVYFNAVDRQLFETALLENVDYAALGMGRGTAMRSFAEETILFLTDAQDSWEPSITVAGFPASRFIPQNFRDHMVTVKGWVSAASTLLVCGTVAAVALAGLGAGHLRPPGRIFKRKGITQERFCRCCSLQGWACGPAWILAACGRCCTATLIPDGIFPADELVMQLFPETPVFGLPAARPADAGADAGGGAGAAPDSLAGKRAPSPSRAPSPPAAQTAKEALFRADATRNERKTGSLAEQGFRSYPGHGIQLRRDRRRHCGKRAAHRQQRHLFPGRYPCALRRCGAGKSPAGAHMDACDRVIDRALQEAGMTLSDAGRTGRDLRAGAGGRAASPGVNCMKGLSYTTRLPLIPVNHIEGHVSANFLTTPDLEPPFLCLVVSGGHSHLTTRECLRRLYPAGANRGRRGGRGLRQGRAGCWGSTTPAGRCSLQAGRGR